MELEWECECSLRLFWTVMCIKLMLSCHFIHCALRRCADDPHIDHKSHPLIDN
jgi:hypothetical protein